MTRRMGRSRWMTPQVTKGGGAAACRRSGPPRQVRASVALATMALLTLAACGTTNGAEPASSSDPATNSTPAPASPPDTTPPPDTAPPSAPEASNGPTTTVATQGGSTTSQGPDDGSSASQESITIAFAGDINFTDAAAANLAADPSTAFGPISGVLSSADLTIANLETAIVTAEGGARASKEFAFKAPSSAFDALAAAGIDVVSMANNHGMDFGQAGLEQSLAAATAKGFPVIGIGNNETDAYRPYITEVKGHKVGVIAATQVLDSSLIEAWTATSSKPGLASAKRVELLEASVKALRPQVDYLIVFLHWGTEKDTCPNGAQTELAPILAAAGADAVVGGHAHRIQSGGYLGGVFVAYGLGNFLFKATSDGAKRSGVLKLTVQSGRTRGYEWIPARIDGENRPIPLDGDAAAAQVAMWNEQRSCTGLSDIEP